MKTTVRAILFALPIAVAAQSVGWRANPEVVRRVSQQQAALQVGDIAPGASALN